MKTERTYYVPKENKRKYVVLALASLLTVLLLVYIFIRIEIRFEVTLIALVALGYILLCLIKNADDTVREYNENELIQMQLREQAVQIEKLESQQEEMRELRHNIKGYFLKTKLLLEDGKVSEANNHISELLTGMDVNTEYNYADNKLVNAILASKISECKKQGIEIETKIGAHIKGIDDMDVAIAILNAMDNAMEAAVKAEKPYIYLEFVNRKNYVVLLVTNSVSEKVLENNKELNTSKPDKKNHGYGIKSIKRIVKKYDGICDISEADMEFTIEIWLKLSA